MIDSYTFAFAIPFEQSVAFAQLSGDRNPLHVDPVAARRTQFGSTVVHGIHAVLRAADGLAAGWTRSELEPVALSVTFNNPVRSGAQVSVRVSAPDDAGEITLVAESEDRLAFTLIITTGNPQPDAPAHSPARGDPPGGECRALAFPPPSALAGEVALSLDPEGLARILPGLAAAGHLAWVADLLASTRIVGMECPGLHSIYAGLKLTRLGAGHPATAAMRYRVARVDPRFRFARIDVSGGHFEGTLDSFFRPPAVDQRSLAQVAETVQPGLFRGQRALVVGGSRGLGEVAAKILLAGGAEVTITYASGRADAERILSEARQSGMHCTVHALDAASPAGEAFPDWLAAGGYSHMYFFASPRIEKNASGRWNHAMFERLSEVYLRGFAALAGALARSAAAPIRLFYPSSVFLDTDEPGFAEYCAAKAAGEALARQLARSLGAIVAAPRLPRMRTDQTSALIDVGAGDPFPVMLEALRGFHA